MTDLDFRSFLRKQFILLGEMHGVRENTEILKMLIEWATQLEEPLILGLEWPEQLTEEINNYLLGASSLSWSSWEFIKHKDGRISQEHIAFLGWLKDFNSRLDLARKVTIQCFDVEAEGWNDRDKSMADVLLKRKNNKVRTIAIMGNFHARKEKFFLDEEEYIPLGSYLPATDTVAIKLDYLSGAFFNKSQKEFVSRENGDAKLLEESRESGYDFILSIPRAHPTSLLK